MGWESNNIFQVVIVFGNAGGIFVYDASNNLVDSVAFQANVDPIKKVNLAGITNYATNAAVELAAGGIQLLSGPAGFAGPWTIDGNIFLASGPTMVLSGASGTGTGIQFLPDTGAAITASGPLNVQAAETVSAGQNASILKVTNTQAAPTSPIEQIFAQAAADNALAIGVTGDTINRLSIDSNGKITIGPGGAAARDTDLFRGGAGILQTDSTFAITNQATPATLAGAAQLFATSGQPAYENPQGLVANLSGAQLATVNVNTVTQTAFTNLASATVPAADAVIGATYKIKAKGNGTWGSTQQQLNLGARFGAAATNVVAQASINLAAFAASAAFTWQAEVEAQCVTTGATGTWIVSITGCVTQTSNAILPGTAADNSVPFAIVTAAPITLDTTVAEILGVSASWGSTTGAPTISKRTSIYGRES